MDSGMKNKEKLFLSWDVDTTGRLLRDDICNIGAYCNDFSIQQYIMPYNDMTYNMRNRHCLATVTMGYYRVLIDTNTGKIVKTKSELFGLLDFLMKLESQAADREIILMCYGRQKLAPFLLIEGLKRYELFDRFKAVVKGFANCFEFVTVNCAKTMVSYSLKTLAKILLDVEPKNLHDASQRAKLVHKIVVHLSTGESNDPIKDLASKMTPYIQSVSEVEQELTRFKEMLDRQRTLKPIFMPLIKVSSKRERAVFLRKYLTDAAIDFQSLNLVFTQEQSLKDYLKSKIGDELPENDLNELETIVTNYFKHPNEPDPKLKVGKKYTQNRSNRRSRSQSMKREEKEKKPSENGTNESGKSETRQDHKEKTSSSNVAVSKEVKTPQKPKERKSPRKEKAVTVRPNNGTSGSDSSPSKESPQPKEARSPKTDNESKAADGSGTHNVQC